MAGIGIEFRRFFTKHSVIDTLRGAAFSLMTTLTPMMAVVLVLLLLYRALGYDTAPYASREVLSAAILYAFVFSLMITSAIGAPISRYVTNMIYVEKPEKVMPCLYTMMIVTAAITAPAGAILSILSVVRGGVAPLFALMNFCLFVSVTLTFYLMNFVMVVKALKAIAAFFAIGMGCTFLTGLLLVYAFKVYVVYAIVVALTLGFVIIGALHYAYARAYFKEGRGDYREILPFLWKWRRLILSNIMYSVGLFAHNFVFWFSDLGELVAGAYRCAPLYDKASCIAMYTNVLATVIFIVQSESHFTDRYRHYSEMVISGRLRDIDTAKSRMLRMRSHVVLSTAEFHFVTSVCLFLLFLFLMPMLGIFGLTTTIYPCMAAGFFALFMMYAQIMYLYYFEDDSGAMCTSGVFMTTTIIASIVARALFSPEWYGMGLFIGAIAGFCFGYFRLIWIENHFDAHIFCKGKLINEKHEPMPSSKVFTREGNV